MTNVMDFSRLDLEPGPISGCQICGNENLELCIDLGHQPLCDTLPDHKELTQPEMTYPLRQMWCPKCTLSQLNYIVSKDVVFHSEYPYRSGITKELAEYQDQLSNEAIDYLKLKEQDLVVDVGSNDGTLLRGFQRRGMRVLGVEPTNIAQIAVSDGIPTVQEFFDQTTADSIRSEHGPAKLITATNVFAHVAALGSFLSGLWRLLDEDGVFMLENHYVMEIIKGGQFDSIYHEHLRSYSLTSLVKLFNDNGFTVMDAQQVSRYGGNVRVYVGKGANCAVSDRVGEILTMEREFGLFEQRTYDEFRARAEKAKDDLLALAIDCKRRGLSFVGNSCPGRSATLLNYAGIQVDLMPWIAEQPTSLKIDRHLAGTHIPILNNQRLIDEQPDYVVLLAWHYADAIGAQLRDRGLHSKFVVPLPELQILDCPK